MNFDDDDDDDEQEEEEDGRFQICQKAIKTTRDTIYVIDYV